MEELLNDVSNKLTTLEQTIQNASEMMDKFLDSEPREEKDIQKAGWYTTIAYALESLSFSLLKMHGIPVKSHPVKADLDRIKKYFEKIARLDPNAPSDKSSLQIDQAAAKRIVSHYASIPKKSQPKITNDPHNPRKTVFESDDEKEPKESSNNEEAAPVVSDDILGKAAAFLDTLQKDLNNKNGSPSSGRQNRSKKRKSQSGTQTPTSSSTSSSPSPSKKSKNTHS